MAGIKGARRQTLDEIGIEEITNRMKCGESQAEIARSFKIPTSSLSNWLNSDVGRSAYARQARQISAESWMDRAQEVLKNIPENGTTAQIAQAKELAQHYRRMAEIRNPREYGPKLDISGKIDHEYSVGNILAQIVPEATLLSFTDHQDLEEATLLPGNTTILDPAPLRDSVNGPD
jgi:hypothetical protein